MFNYAYSETSEGDQGEARSQEYQALVHTIVMMEGADASPQDGVKRIQAIYDSAQVWTALLQDLASQDNHYTNELKAGIISIGIYILKHLQRMRDDKTLTFATVIELTNTIKEGLK
ncbi:MAG: flagellar biosynthesis regulator FlaF [Nitratireductor sp.]